MNIKLYPFESNDNKYLEILKDNISNNEFNVYPFSENIINNFLEKKESGNTIVHFNWYENIQAVNTFRTLLRFGKRVTLIKILKLKKIPYIVTIHNRLPHNAKNTLLIKTFSKILYKNSSRITILSRGTYKVLEEQYGKEFLNTIQNKISYIPHPNYIGSYKTSSKTLNQDNKMVFLFVGAIKPYKNIELIIRIANYFSEHNLDAKFIIAGGGNQQYIEEINHQISSAQNIEFIPKFIPDDEIVDYLQKADILMLPYNLRSSLNSGTCLLAFSNHLNVICPRISTIQEYDLNLTYNYSYKNDQDHYDKILQQALRAYTDYMSHHQLFLQKGETLFKLVTDKNKPCTIGELYHKLYIEALGRDK